MKKVFDIAESDGYEELKVCTFKEFEKLIENKAPQTLIMSELCKSGTGKGSEQDLMRMWHTFYNQKGWAKIAPCRLLTPCKGKLGNAYM